MQTHLACFAHYEMSVADFILCIPRIIMYIWKKSKTDNKSRKNYIKISRSPLF